MRKATANDLNTASEWPLWREELTYLDLLGVDRTELDDELRTRTVVILCSAYPDSWRQYLNRARKRIARQADEDLRNDIEATKAATQLMQEELDRRTLAAKQKRLDDAARDIARTDRRIEYNTLKRRLNGKGFRQKS